MTFYVPGTLETDQKRFAYSLQQIAPSLDTANANIVLLQTAGQGLVNSAGSLAVQLSKITASLGADVALNNTGTYFDGPSVAPGSSGTWFVSGTVTLIDTGATAAFNCKLWDGTTVIASARGSNWNVAAQTTVTLSGYIASPAGNLRISVNDVTATTGKILFNSSGNSKDSTISAIRIA